MSCGFFLPGTCGNYAEKCGKMRNYSGKKLDLIIPHGKHWNHGIRMLKHSSMITNWFYVLNCLLTAGGVGRTVPLLTWTDTSTGDTGAFLLPQWLQLIERCGRWKAHIPAHQWGQSHGQSMGHRCRPPPLRCAFHSLFYVPAQTDELVPERHNCTHRTRPPVNRGYPSAGFGTVNQPALTPSCPTTKLFFELTNGNWELHFLKMPR